MSSLKYKSKHISISVYNNYLYNQIDYIVKEDYMIATSDSFSIYEKPILDIINNKKSSAIGIDLI